MLFQFINLSFSFHFLRQFYKTIYNIYSHTKLIIFFNMCEMVEITYNLKQEEYYLSVYLDKLHII